MALITAAAVRAAVVNELSSQQPEYVRGGKRIRPGGRVSALQYPDEATPDERAAVDATAARLYAAAGALVAGELGVAVAALPDNRLVDEALVRVVAYASSSLRPDSSTGLSEDRESSGSGGAGSFNARINHSLRFQSGQSWMRLSGARQLLANLKVRRAGVA